KAYDLAGNVATATVTFVHDTMPPSVSLTAPQGGSTVSGTVTVSANATDNVGVQNVYFYVDGALINSDSVAPYGVSWNTANVADGPHTLRATAYDVGNHSADSATVTVTVLNHPASNNATYDSALRTASCR